MLAPILFPNAIFDRPTAIPPSASEWMAFILPSAFNAYIMDA